MNAQKAKAPFAEVKQVRRYNGIDLIKAEYATIQLSMTVFHPVTQQLVPFDSSKFSGINRAERFHNSPPCVVLTSLHFWLILVVKINI